MEVRKAVATFKGVTRRFDVRVKCGDVVYIDDYAHHPGELKATIESVQELYPDKKVLGVFQPHLYSRTKDFADGFAESLDLLDEAIVLDVYPAREAPINGVNAEMIVDKMNLKKKSTASLDNIVGVLKDKEFDVLLTMGAGNIDRIVGDVENMLNTKYRKQ